MVRDYLKRYRYPFIGALILHFLLFGGFLLVPEKPERPVRLVNFQMLNLKPPKEPTVSKKPPKKRKKVKPKKVIKKKVTPKKKSEFAEKKVEKPVEEPVEKPAPVIDPVPDLVPELPAIVSESALDNKSVKPFGNKRPHYPQFARDAEIEGWVKLKVLVNKKGRVTQVKVDKVVGHKSFAKETIKVAKKWRFPPLTAKGRRVEAWITQTVLFQLTD
ncbi:MAG: TonB family protein [Fibrobacterales bacterium]